MSRQHISFHCSETGLHVYKENPYLAASPDGIIECKCCGKGLLEIKCTFSLRHELAQVAMAKKLIMSFVKWKIWVKKNLSSSYYVQMLGQMAICDLSFCDLVLCTQKDLYIERVQFTAEDWGPMVQKLTNFIQHVCCQISPENLHCLMYLIWIHWKLSQAPANVIFCVYRWFHLNFLELLPLVEQ